MPEILTALFLLSSVAQANCDLLAPWVKAVGATQLATSIGERIAADQAEWSERNLVTRQIYCGYRDGSVNLPDLDKCLDESPLRGNFSNTLNRVFFDETISDLQNIHGPVADRLFAVLTSGQASDRRLIFRLTGQFGNISPVDKKAGFHRSSRSLFVDLGRTPANEWMLIFVHEILHSLDDDLYRATETYGEVDSVRVINGVIPTDTPEFHGWLEAGLSRGLFAEYRAWYYTALVYREGLKAGRWHSIDWMDAVLADPGPDLSRTIYNYLDRNFVDPTDGIFARPEIAAALGRERQSYRTGNKLPDLGFLGQLLR